MENKYIYAKIIILLLLLLSVYYYNNIPNQPELEDINAINTRILDFVLDTYTIDDITTPKWDK
jgi:hypothetical protein